MGAPECLGGYKQNKLHNEYNKLKSGLKIKILKIIIIIHAKNPRERIRNLVIIYFAFLIMCSGYDFWNEILVFY